MAELTQEEIAVLNKLIYVDANWWKNIGDRTNLLDIVHVWKQTYGWPDKNDAAGQGIVHAVENNDYSLGRLQFRQATDVDGKYSDSPILTLENDGKAIVIFRGTEGMAELLDDGQGLYETDTNAQQHAMDYINMLHDEYGYESISVSGHSKGGNKAMYVALLSEYVTDCTAFDAQGFSLAFTEKYKSQIAERSERITLYMPDKSQVGVLLYPVAGKIVYTSTDGLDAEKYKLGIFGYHMPDTVYEIDDDGRIWFRREAECSETSRTLGQVSQFLSAVVYGSPMKASEHALTLGEIVLGGFAERTGEIMDYWIKGVYPDGSPALSTQMWSFMEGIFPWLSGAMGEGLGLLSGDEGNAPDIITALQFLAGRLPVLAAALAQGTVTVGGVDMAVGSGTVFTLAAAAAAAWTFVKLLELAIPLLQSAGIAIGEIAGLALGMAASMIVEMVTGIIQTADAAAKAVWSVWTGIAGFFGELASGVAAFIQGIFGSAYAAMSYAQDIDVTMSRIEEMRRRLGNLYQCYSNARNAAEAAEQTAGRVSSYYRESYVRSCCSDIQHHIRCAKSSIDSVEYALDRQRRMLSEAIEAYRRKDQEAAGTARRYSGGSGW